MAIKDILVHVDSTEACAARVDLAVGLAEAHGAHLIGLCVFQAAYIPGFVMAEAGPLIREAQERATQQAVEQARALFEASVGRSAGLSAEWRRAEGPAGEIVPLHARYADLAIVGQTDPDTETARGAAHVADDVALGSGGAALVVPYAGRFEHTGEHVMVAWDAGLHATRAVRCAMPFLERAKRVTILTLNPERVAEGLGDLPGADLATHLAHHGIEVEVATVVTDVAVTDYVADTGHRAAGAVVGHVSAADMSIGDALLSRIADEGVDLLVMGAYGHSRLRELILGGVTRHVLRNMTVPVLMAH